MTATHSTQPLSRPQWSFGDRIRKIRRQAGLTQAEFAARLDVTANNVDSWESDRNKPRDLLGFAHKVETVFRIHPAWLLGIDSD